MSKRKSGAGKHLRRMLRKLVSKAPQKLRLKILGTVLGSGMIIVFIQTCLKYHNDSEEIYARTEHTLHGVVRTLSTQIDVKAHKRLLANFRDNDEIVSLTQNSDYYTIHTALKRARQANNLHAEIYTLIPGGTIDKGIIAVSSSDQIMFRSVYGTNNGTDSGLQIDTSNEYKKVITVSTPLKDENGTTIAHIVASSDSKTLADLLDQKKIELGINIGLLVLTILLLIYILLNPLLQEQEESQLKLMLKNQEWTESVQYARKIQEAILPVETNFTSAFSEIFVFNKPKDIVSGDLLWNHVQDNKFFVSLIDCTGHGVPGAFLTFLTYDALNRIVIDEKIVDPSAILEKLDTDLKSTLKKGETLYNMYGLDIAFCLFDFDKMEFTYSGARHNMLAINGSLRLIKGARRSIGETIGDKRPPFTNTTNSFHSSDNFYFWTDGLQDQFGGPLDRKLSTKNLISMIEEVSHFPLIKQKEIITLQFESWKGKNEQIDDVFVVGLRA